MSHKRSRKLVISKDLRFAKRGKVYVEVGLRRRTSADYREIETALGAERGERAEWAKSEAKPKGVRMVASTLKVDTSGYFRTTMEALRCIQEGGDNACVMVKITGNTLQKLIEVDISGRSASETTISVGLGDSFFFVPALAGCDDDPARGRTARSSKLYSFDRVQPQREDGSYVYSLPMHNFNQVGAKRYFFVMALADTPSGNEFSVYKVSLGIAEDSQGPYFTVNCQKHTSKPVNELSDLLGFQSREIALKHLPIAGFIAARDEFLKSLGVD